MQTEPLAVTVNLVNEKVRFTGVARANPAVTFDYFPPLGDGEGYTGLEMLLMSLAACSGTSIVALLRKMHKEVAACTIAATGVRRDTHPTVFATITLTFTVQATDLAVADLQKAVRLSEESFCPVWAMLKGNVEIITECQVCTPEGALASEIV